MVLLATAGRAVAAETFTLDSGRSVEILTVGPMSSGRGSPVLALKYRSDIAATDAAALRKEVDEIWQHLVVDADGGDYQAAIVTPTLATGASHDFAFARKHGTWRTYESKQRVKARLDRNFVAQFIDRLDWLFDRHETDALRLYLASDWTLTSTNAADPSVDPKVESAAPFLDALEEFSASVKSYHHERKIVDIAIDRGGMTARITSREFEDIVDEANHLVTSSHSVDFVELTGDGIMLLMKSENVMDKVVKEKMADLPPREPRLVQQAAAAARD